MASVRLAVLDLGKVRGKVEGFNRTLLEEWAYAELHRSNGMGELRGDRH